MSRSGPLCHSKPLQIFRNEQKKDVNNLKLTWNFLPCCGEGSLRAVAGVHEVELGVGGLQQRPGVHRAAVAGARAVGHVVDGEGAAGARYLVPHWQLCRC